MVVNDRIFLVYGRIRSFTESVTFKLGCRILFRSHYCFLHQDYRLSAEVLRSISNRYKIDFRGKKSRYKKNWKSQQKEAFEATDCRTSTARSDAYIRQYSRSFELIAYITNCRVFISFGEIFRTEILREILYLLFSTLRVEYI